MFVIEDVVPEKDKYGHWIYKAVCQECGFIKYSHYGRIKNPISEVCAHINQIGNYNDYSTKWDNPRIGNIFRGMKQRCYNEDDESYRFYGQKGIKICDEWINNPIKFEEWAINNGYNDGLTIDRINEKRDYCPDNCRWVTHVDNSKYKSTTDLIEIDGEIYTGKDWAKVLGLGINLVNRYVVRYGKENTIEFIRRYLSTPKLNRNNGQSYYDLYMTNSSITA